VILPFTQILTVAMALWTKHLHFNISLIRQVIVISILALRTAFLLLFSYPRALSRYRLLFIFVKCRFFISLSFFNSYSFIIYFMSFLRAASSVWILFFFDIYFLNIFL
jgi:hypothetical protein